MVGVTADGVDYDIIRIQTELYTTLNDLKWAEQRIRVLEVFNFCINNSYFKF